MGFLVWYQNTGCQSKGGLSACVFPVGKAYSNRSSLFRLRLSPDLLKKKKNIVIAFS